MINTLAKSGTLYELHTKRGSLRIAVDFYARRARHLRRAIRRQRFALLKLRIRRWWNTPTPGITALGLVWDYNHSESVKSASSAVESIPSSL